MELWKLLLASALPVVKIILLAAVGAFCARKVMVRSAAALQAPSEPFTRPPPSRHTMRCRPGNTLHIRARVVACGCSGVPAAVPCAARRTAWRLRSRACLCLGHAMPCHAFSDMCPGPPNPALHCPDLPCPGSTCILPLTRTPPARRPRARHAPSRLPACCVVLLRMGWGRA